MRAFRYAAIVCLATTALSAQSIDDGADLLSADAEARVLAELTQLKEDTGLEMTVVTRANSGSASRNSSGPVNTESMGLVVIQDSRDVRIDLGDDFGSDYDDASQSIIDDTIIPAFQSDEFEKGIEDGTSAIITRIGHPFKGFEPPAPPAAEGGGFSMWWLLGIFGVPIAAIVGINRRNAAKLAATPCPTCGKTGLTKKGSVVTEPTYEAEGLREMRTSCPHCDWSEAETSPIGKLEREDKKSSSSQQSGAQQSGKGSKKSGGASGKW